MVGGRVVFNSAGAGGRVLGKGVIITLSPANEGTESLLTFHIQLTNLKYARDSRLHASPPTYSIKHEANLALPLKGKVIRQSLSHPTLPPLELLTGIVPLPAQASQKNKRRKGHLIGLINHVPYSHTSFDFIDMGEFTCLEALAVDPVSIDSSVRTEE
jgi:hypothetical protein